MEQINIGYTRRKELICTEEKLNRIGSNIVLDEGEVVYVKMSDGNWKSKIGDGSKNLLELPFLGDIPEISTADNGKVLSVVDGKIGLSTMDVKKIGTFYTNEISYWFQEEEYTHHYIFGGSDYSDFPSMSSGIVINELVSLLERATFFVVEFWTPYGTGPFVIYSGVTNRYEGELELDTKLGTNYGVAFFSDDIWRSIFFDQGVKASKVSITGYKL